MTQEELDQEFLDNYEAQETDLDKMWYLMNSFDNSLDVLSVVNDHVP